MGWTGIYCESKTNYCENIICLNYGVCRPLLRNFTCECLDASYSGRYCEITPRKIIIHRIVARSIGYVAIICLISTGLFIIIMDVLKYVFNIDPCKDELDKLRKKKIIKKKKGPPVIQKFMYVNESPVVKETKISVSTIEETVKNKER